MVPGQPVPIELGRRMVDFAERGFALGNPATRRRLEECASAFVEGFNVASRSWPDPHAALATIAAPMRGFAYEGAGMSARLAASMRPRAGRRCLATLLDGPGARYVHLVHVGYGWMPPIGPLAAPLRPPATGLVRWLSYDGDGFCRAFFGGDRAIDRMIRTASRSSADPTAGIRLAGVGRALWFITCADPAALAARIAAAPAAARGDLWSGVGLAMTYAGGVDDETIDAVTAAAGPARAPLGQGVAFAATALVLAGSVQSRARAVVTSVLGATPEQVADAVDVASDGLAHRPDVQAYEEWRARIQRWTT